MQRYPLLDSLLPKSFLRQEGFRLDKDKSTKGGKGQSLTIVGLCCVAILAFVIYQYKTGALTKSEASVWGVFSLTPYWGYSFFYSIIKNVTYVSAYTFQKDKDNLMYWLSTIIWGALLMFSIAYMALAIVD